MDRDVLLAYADIYEEFKIHTDARNFQLGAFISQNGKPIAFYSKKLNGPQKMYSVKTVWQVHALSAIINI